MGKLANSVVIENVLVSKMRGKVVYQSSFPASVGQQLLFVKPYDLPSGKGYQRPVDTKRCEDFSKYLSQGEDALFTPILLNASSQWEFSTYDSTRPNFGRLFCKGKASLMDGQHRMGGIQKYLQETNSEISVPFLAFHSLDEEEEIKLFDTINTKAKGIGPSLSKFLRRDSDDISWVATELMIRKESPFYMIGSIIGKRSKGRHVTLQNLYRTLHFLTRSSRLAAFTKEEKLSLAMSYYSSIKELLPEDWADYKGSRLTHIVCIDALSIAGCHILTTCLHEMKRQIDLQLVQKQVKHLSRIDWSTTGSLKYLKGLNGSKQLAEDLKNIMTIN